MRGFCAFVAGIAAFLLFSVPARSQETLLQKKGGSLLIDAVADFDEGNFSRARERLSTIVDLDPRNDAAFFYLGLCCMNQQDYKSASKFLSEAVALDSTNYWYRENQARSFVLTGETSAAMERYERLVADYPDKQDPLYVLGRIYRAAGMYEKMNETFEQIYVKFGAYPDVLLMMGEYQMSIDCDSLALRYYDEALEMDPDYAPARLERSELHRMNGNIPAFFSDLTGFTASGSVGARFKVDCIRDLFSRTDGNFLRFNKPQMDAVIDTLYATHLNDTVATPFVLSYHYAMKEYDKMLDRCEKFALAFPKDPGVQLTFVQTLNIAGRVDASLSYAERCMKDFPKEEAFPQYIGDILQEGGDVNRAFKYYDKVLKINPDNIPVLNNYAYFLSLEGKKLKKAYKMSEKTVKAEPDNSTYLDTFGWILHLLGKDVEAKPVFKHAMLYGGKDSAVILEHYATVLEALGERDLASVYRDLAKKKQSSNE